MNITHLVYKYFKTYTGETINSRLIRDIVDNLQQNPSYNEMDVMVSSVTKLRTDYGYNHPIEEQADQNASAPFLAELKRFPRIGKEKK